MEIDPVIREEIEHLKSILIEMGLGKGIIKTDSALDMKTNKTGHSVYYSKDNVLYNLSYDIYGQEVVIIYLNPETTEIEYWDELYWDIMHYHRERKFNGIVFIRCPKLTSYKKIEGWYEVVGRIRGDDVCILQDMNMKKLLLMIKGKLDFLIPAKKDIQSRLPGSRNQRLLDLGFAGPISNGEIEKSPRLKHSHLTDYFCY